MAHDIQCWKCGASLSYLATALRPHRALQGCDADLHVCRLCREFDRELSAAVPRTHGRGSARQGTRQLLRSLQAGGRRVQGRQPAPRPTRRSRSWKSCSAKKLSRGDQTAAELAEQSRETAGRAVVLLLDRCADGRVVDDLAALVQRQRRGAEDLQRRFQRRRLHPARRSS